MTISFVALRSPPLSTPERSFVADAIASFETALEMKAIAGEMRAFRAREAGGAGERDVFWVSFRRGAWVPQRGSGGGP